MAGLNKVELIGRLGNDPETRYLPNGNAVTNISLATSETWTDKESGERQERTEWHRVAFFGKVAEIAGKYLRKGSQCYVEGKLQTREWEKDGVKRYTTEVVVDSFNGRLLLLDSRQAGDNDNGQQAPRQQNQQRQQQGAPRTQQQAPRQQAPQPAPDYDSFGDDIPF